MVAHLQSLSYRRRRPAEKVPCAAGAVEVEKVGFKAPVSSKLFQVAGFTQLPVQEITLPAGSEVHTDGGRPLRKGAVMQLAGLADRHPAKEHAMSVARLAEFNCMADLTPDQQI